MPKLVLVNKVEQLRELLRKRDRDGVERWIRAESKGRFVHLPENIYEGWIYLAQTGTLDQLVSDVQKTL